MDRQTKELTLRMDGRTSKGTTNGYAHGRDRRVNNVLKCYLIEMILTSFNPGTPEYALNSWSGILGDFR